MLKKITLLICCVYLTMFSISLNAQQKINLKLKDVSLEKVIKEIEKSTSYSFMFDNSLDLSQKVSVNYAGEPVNVILKSLFIGRGITYEISGNQIVLKKKNEALGSPKKKTGVIVDADNIPLIGVTVSVKGTTSGTTTDIDGKYTINANENDILVFSYLGYTPVEKTVKGDGELNITMQEDNVMLDAVVVTALGIKRAEKALSYNVQQITNEDLTTVKNANFVNSLAGKVAGVQINSSAAGPGSAAKVVMRGSKSITLSNNALYVIDGIPMNNYMGSAMDEGAYSSQPGTESAADINPDDIESMSVLTGPSAAALYGYEGANGVILITTKKGRAGRVSVSYSNSTTFSSAMKMPEFQNTYGNVDGSSMSWGSETDYRFDPKKFFNTGTNVANTVSLSTGSEHSQNYFSASANNASGILPNNDYDRYNFTYRNTTSFANNKFLLDVGANYIVQKSKNMVSQGQYFNPLPALYLFPRGEDFSDVQLYERYDSSREVETQFWPYGDQGLSLQNPYWIMNKMNRQVDRKRYMLSASLKYEITDWLNVVGRVNIDNSTFKNTDKRYAGTYETFAGRKGRYRLDTRTEGQIYADAIANIDKRIGDFSINVNMGGSIKDRRMDSHMVEGDLNKVTNWFTTENMSTTGAFKQEDDGIKRQTQSIFANAEIGYKDFLYLTLTGRNDWDSALAWSQSPERSFFYPSVGVSSLLSEVITLPKWFSYLKARLSFTSVGNSYDPYLTREFYMYDPQTDSYYLPKIKPNYYLKPEITNSYEAGLNMKFFSGALSLDATYYYSNTKNQTHLAKLENAEYENVLIQAGSVVNSGIELALGYDKKWGNFGWTSNYTFTYNKNKIKRLVRDVEVDGQEIEMTQIDKATLGSSGSPIVRLTEGGTMGDIYMTSDFKRDNNGYIYLDHATLLPSMVNLNPDEYKKVGSLLPKYHMGWRNSFSFKGLRLNILISGRFGGMVISNTQAMLDRYGVSKYSADLREVGGVNINGRNIPAQDYLNVVGEGTGKADHYVYKADNIRLQELSLEYTISRKYLKNVADLTLGFVGSNLALLYCKAPFDPEVVASASSTYYTGVDYFMQPSLRNLGFSVKVQF